MVGQEEALILKVNNWDIFRPVLPVFSHAVMLKVLVPVWVGVPLIDPPVVSVTPGTSGKELDPKGAVVVLHERAICPLTPSTLNI